VKSTTESLFSSENPANARKFRRGRRRFHTNTGPDDCYAGRALAREPERPRPEQPEEQGILGNLPRTRPGVPSPRRTQAQRPSGPERVMTEASGPAGLPSAAEELARAGAGLAAGAAAAGFRLAGRAAGELGRVLGRR
jgi:hypothetical protein